jgi:alpha-glucosidase (family GH31 glycosyl hydrolase)
MRNALQMRYTILPYLYTLFAAANTRGTTVARPLFFEFPQDRATWPIDQQFLLGSGLLVSPVLQQGATQVVAYLPNGLWSALLSSASTAMLTSVCRGQV